MDDTSISRADEPRSAAGSGSALPPLSREIFCPRNPLPAPAARTTRFFGGGPQWEIGLRVASNTSVPLGGAEPGRAPVSPHPPPCSGCRRMLWPGRGCSSTAKAPLEPPSAPQIPGGAAWREGEGGDTTKPRSGGESGEKEGKKKPQISQLRHVLCGKTDRRGGLLWGCGFVRVPPSPGTVPV